MLYSIHLNSRRFPKQAKRGFAPQPYHHEGVPMEKIIEVSGLKKSYGSVYAVKGVDFYVEKGRMFALLGTNGAGKSTIIDMLCTFLKPDAGEVLVDGLTLGKDDAGIRKKIGAVFQDGLLDPLLTVEENLRARGGRDPHAQRPVLHGGAAHH